MISDSYVRTTEEDTNLLYPVGNVDSLVYSMKISGDVRRSATNMAECQDDNASQNRLYDSKCIFCQIVEGKAEGELLYNDDEYICIRDIKPHAPHHYLIIPKSHHLNVKYLTSEHCSMVTRMAEIGRQILTEQNCDLNDSRFGFHWPPFQSVEHLHFHAMSPVSRMSFISKLIFRNEWPMVTPEWALNYLRTKPSKY